VRQLARDALFFVVGIHLVDQVGELPLQQRALDLARRRHGLAFDLGIELAVENAERFTCSTRPSVAFACSTSRASSSLTAALVASDRCVE
jgi:hypothetical protein